MSHEQRGQTDEWYTPKYIFDALGCEFDLDVASPEDLTHIHVPAKQFIKNGSLEMLWNGFIWMNPPYGDQKVKKVWLDKFFKHGNGIALMPDRTSTQWWQDSSQRSDIILLVNKRISFIRSDGTLGKEPSNGTALFGVGEKAVNALLTAQKNGLGVCLKTNNISA